MRLIDADWVLENAKNVVLKIFSNEPAERAVKHQGHMFRSLIKRAPTIDAEPVRHGRWISAGNGVYYCSKCDRRVPFALGHRYCPNCGAKMDGDAP